MKNDFEVACKNCKNSQVEIQATVIQHGANCRVQLVCTNCHAKKEVTVNQVCIHDFIK